MRITSFATKPMIAVAFGFGLAFSIASGALAAEDPSDYRETNLQDLARQLAEQEAQGRQANKNNINETFDTDQIPATQTVDGDGDGAIDLSDIPFEDIADCIGLEPDFDKRIATCTELMESELITAEHYRLYRAIAYLEAGRDEEAMADYDAYVEIAPWDSEAFLERGKAHVILGNTELALADFDQTIALYAGSSEARYRRGSIYADREEHQKAIEDYTEGLKEAYIYEPDLLYARGYSYASLEHYALARGDFVAYLAIYPGDTEGLFARAFVEEMLGLCPSAIVGYEKAIELNPIDDVRFFEGAARVLATCHDVSLRNGEDAVAYAEKAFALNDDLDIRSTLAAAYAQAERYTEAVSVQQSVVDGLAQFGDLYTDELEEEKRILDLYRAGTPYEALPGPFLSSQIGGDASQDSGGQLEAVFGIWILGLSVAALATLLIAIIAPFPLNARYQKRHPQTRPYRWGYFTALSNYLGSAFYLSYIVMFYLALQLGLYSVIETTFGEMIDAGVFVILAFGLLLVFALILFLMGRALMRRRRWPWVVTILLAILAIAAMVLLQRSGLMDQFIDPSEANLGLSTWINVGVYSLYLLATFVYVSKRWGELGRKATDKLTKANRGKKKAKKKSSDDDNGGLFEEMGMEEDSDLQSSDDERRMPSVEEFFDRHSRDHETWDGDEVEMLPSDNVEIPEATLDPETLVDLEEESALHDLTYRHQNVDDEGQRAARRRSRRRRRR